MKNLNLNEVHQVSGGSFEMVVVAHVGDPAMGWVENLATAIMSDQIVGTAAFLTAFTNAVSNGANFDTVRIHSIDFNSMD